MQRDKALNRVDMIINEEYTKIESRVKVKKQ